MSIMPMEFDDLQREEQKERDLAEEKGLETDEHGRYIDPDGNIYLGEDGQVVHK